MLTDPERQAALQAVIAASHLCQNVRAHLAPAESKEKADKSPVTIADFGAQAIVLQQIRELDGRVAAVAEEDADDFRLPEHQELFQRVCHEVNRIRPHLTQGEIFTAIDSGRHPGGVHGRFWTLDPIDGTKGFLRNDQYAIALALIEEGEVVFGVLGCPYLPLDWQQPDGPRGCLFMAEKGAGCQQLDLSGNTLGCIRVSGTSDPAAARFCESVESGHSKHDWSARVAEQLGITSEPVRMDSQCKYAAIARGDAAIYLRLPTRAGYEEKIWDHAAGCICVSEAGGKVTDIGGAPLDFSRGRTLKDNQGVIATNGLFHDKVVQAAQAGVAS